MSLHRPALHRVIAVALALAASLVSVGTALADGGFGPLPH
jgi:hypothetical protein